jgi:hypothetical protein
MYGAIGAGISMTFSDFLTSITGRLHIGSSSLINTIITVMMVATAI